LFPKSLFRKPIFQSGNRAKASLILISSWFPTIPTGAFYASNAAPEQVESWSGFRKSNSCLIIAGRLVFVEFAHSRHANPAGISASVNAD
jgi:hypothetical protein